MPYEAVADLPHVVVDGRAQPSTRLTLSHWPGSPTPADLLDDLSAQIAFRALERPEHLEGLDIVTNNHFDQDGLASAFALVDPSAATARREAVIDVARAGDFGTFRDHDSMRTAFALAAFDDPQRSPLDRAVFEGGYADQCARLYQEALPRFAEMIDRPDRHRSLWELEDAHLRESLDAIGSGIATIAEDPSIDLAVVRVPEDWIDRATTRFTVSRRDALHPAAVNQSTDRMRVATVQDGTLRLELRYETWVMYRSRPLAARPDLRPLAERLQQVDAAAMWTADAPGALTPALRHDGITTLTPEAFIGVVRDHLRTAPAAWDPSAGR
jgi:hypothetical protein